MAEIAAVNGTSLLVQVAGTTITGQVESGVSMVRDLIEITNKQSPGQAKAYLAAEGEYGGEFTASYNYDTTGAAENFETAFDDFKANTSQTVTFGGVESGDLYLTASAMIRNIDWNGPKAGVASCSVTYQITGEISKATVS